MRTQLAALLTLLLVVAAVIAGVLVGGSTILSQPGPLPTRALTVAPSRSPVPVETVAPDALRVFSIGAIPADYHLALLGDPGDERLILLDPGARKIKLIAHFEGVGGFDGGRTVEIASTASADTVVIHLRSDRPTARLYFIRPVTGEVRSVTTPRSENPRLSPDAATLAVSRNSQDPDENGLWLLRTSDGATTKRLTTDVGRRATRAVQWSADGRRLSALVDPDGLKPELIVLGVGGDATPSIASATDARWRGSDLLYWNGTVAGSVHVYTSTGGTAIAYPTAPGVIVLHAAVRPRSNDLAIRQRTTSSVPVIVLYDSSTGEATVKMADAQLALGFWWSSDGSHLYVWTIDNGTTTVTDLLTGTPVLTLCFHGPVKPPCP